MHLSRNFELGEIVILKNEKLIFQIVDIRSEGDSQISRSSCETSHESRPIPCYSEKSSDFFFEIYKVVNFPVSPPPAFR